MADKVLAYATALVAKRQSILEEGHRVLAQHLRDFADAMETLSASMLPAGIETLRPTFPWCPEAIARQRQSPAPEWLSSDPAAPHAADELRSQWFQQEKAFVQISSLYGAIRGGAGEEKLYPAG